MNSVSLREAWRGARKGTVLLSLLIAGVCDLFFERSAGLRERSRRRRRWCERILRSLGLALTIEGTVPQRGVVVCNHLSYLDIIALGSVFEGVFVSKREVRKWPLIGLFTELAGTIFVDRTSRAASSHTVEDMRAALRKDVPVMFFPEGTSSDGSCVLRFRAALFQAALDSEVPVFPASVDYMIEGQRTGVSKAICYHGEMTFFPHLLRFLCLRDVSATVRFGKPLLLARDRFDLASQAQTAVAELANLPAAPDPVARAESPLDGVQSASFSSLSAASR